MRYLFYENSIREFKYFLSKDRTALECKEYINWFTDENRIGKYLMLPSGHKKISGVHESLKNTFYDIKIKNNY